MSSYGPDDNSLPPIQLRPSVNDGRVKHSAPPLSRRRSDEDTTKTAGRKRTHAEVSSRNEDSQPDSA